jgi:hypothetical protein
MMFNHTHFLSSSLLSPSISHWFSPLHKPSPFQGDHLIPDGLVWVWQHNISHFVGLISPNRELPWRKWLFFFFLVTGQLWQNESYSDAIFSPCKDLVSCYKGKMAKTYSDCHWNWHWVLWECSKNIMWDWNVFHCKCLLFEDWPWGAQSIVHTC